MRRAIVIALAAVLFFLGFSRAAAQEPGNQTIPEGMEVVQIGPSEVIVPRGSRVVRKGGLITLESTNEYVARQIASMDERIKKIEEQQEEIGKEIGEIKNSLAGQKQAVPVPAEGGVK